MKTGRKSNQDTPAMRNRIRVQSFQNLKYITYSLFFLLFIVFNSMAQEIHKEEQVTIFPPPVMDESYSYITEGRSDPFRPFISPKATIPVGADPNEIILSDTELTGMQLFEPGQLTLVGTLISPSGRLAMVEDQTKKGYILKEGVLIGRHGVVTQIDKDQVIITETAYTRAGKEITTMTTMKIEERGR